MELFVCLILGLTCAISHAQTKFVVARYQANGDLDLSFSGGRVGTAFKDPDSQADIAATLKDLALFPQTANAIAVGKAGRFAALASYTSSGNLNPGFNHGAGKRLLHLLKPQIFWSVSSNADSAANAVALKNGKIVVAGYFGGELCNNLSEGCATWSRQFAVARFNADGTLDQTFDGDGRLRISFQNEGAESSEAYAVTIDASDHIIVGGTAKLGSTETRFAVARYHWDGTPDLTFGGTGRVIRALPLDGPLVQRIRDLTIDQNGHIVATGTAVWNYNSARVEQFVILRFLWNGWPDTGFYPDGIKPVFAYTYDFHPQNLEGSSSEGFPWQLCQTRESLRAASVLSNQTAAKLRCSP